MRFLLAVFKSIGYRWREACEYYPVHKGGINTAPKSPRPAPPAAARPKRRIITI